ncbi:MAG: hypothetical protein ACREIF_11795 [Chthoniobacterales bacterium]
MKIGDLPVIAAIEQAGIPALRVASTLVYLAGALIWRRRHQLFDADPEVENDLPVVRHSREEGPLPVCGHLTIVLLSILDQGWCA